MSTGGVVGKDDALEGLGGGLAGVAVPDAAADQIDPTVTVHVERYEADVRLVVCADRMLHPGVGALVLEPVER